MTQLVGPPHRLPSRHANPFATCWTKPGALAFHFPSGESAAQLVAQLAATDWQGEIVGPHGSGKSTLLALAPHFVAAGQHPCYITLRDGQRRLPPNFLRESLSDMRALIVIDGFEQLSRLQRWLVRYRCRRAAAGLVVSSHTPIGMPLLYRMQPTLALAEELVSTLTTQNSSPITPTDVAASHACHGSNFRELLFALYDRHEALVGAQRIRA